MVVMVERDQRLLSVGHGKQTASLSVTFFDPIILIKIQYFNTLQESTFTHYITFICVFTFKKKKRKKKEKSHA